MVENLLQQYQAGGAAMHLLLVVAGFGIWIVLERIITLKSAGSIDKDEVLSTVSSYILQGHIDKAISVCTQVQSPITNIINAGLVAVKNGKSEEEVQTSMDAVALREVPRIEKRISLISTIANLAIVAGLLGTVCGLIEAYTLLTSAAPNERSLLYAGKIASSMNCAAFGLLIAVPLIGAHGWLGSWSQSVVDDIHEASVTTLNFILSNRDKIT